MFMDLSRVGFNSALCFRMVWVVVVFISVRWPVMVVRGMEKFYKNSGLWLLSLDFVSIWLAILPWDCYWFLLHCVSGSERQYKA